MVTIIPRFIHTCPTILEKQKRQQLLAWLDALETSVYPDLWSVTSKQSSSEIFLRQSLFGKYMNISNQMCTKKGYNEPAKPPFVNTTYRTPDTFPMPLKTTTTRQLIERCKLPQWLLNSGKSKQSEDRPLTFLLVHLPDADDLLAMIPFCIVDRHG